VPKKRTIHHQSKGKHKTRVCKKCGGKGIIPKSIMKGYPSGAKEMIDGQCRSCQGRGKR
jgi:DnaJ-class molecular chaperone